ncbi:type II toxin-antitoxin system VapC family toxin [Mycobacteroides abscessus]|uniref:type II toxin-antitoxin system VapC family toxin n=1 Tax=Mycobacteroides abscessus TaxID=36809 RepID=UPI000C259342|nr:PIN domain-containing protein [Mycobacteroides abscessus]RIS66628.1 type II toxin-antitoxin system VapC family toxin [Mycobacteroides abscessus]
MTIVLDASVLIAHANPADEHHWEAGRLLAEWASFGYAASVLTLAEFYVGPARTGHLAAAQQMITSLDVTALDIPTGAAAELARIRARHALKMPDAVVLYTAKAHAAALGTFDTRLGAEALRAGLQVAPDYGTGERP